jgi:hypothetical protein
MILLLFLQKQNLTSLQASRRKLHIDTSQRLNEETGAMVVFDDNVRKRMRQFKLDRCFFFTKKYCKKGLTTTFERACASSS